MNGGAKRKRPQIKREQLLSAAIPPPVFGMGFLNDDTVRMPPPKRMKAEPAGAQYVTPLKIEAIKVPPPLEMKTPTPKIRGPPAKKRKISHRKPKPKKTKLN